MDSAATTSPTTFGVARSSSTSKFQQRIRRKPSLPPLLLDKLPPVQIGEQWAESFSSSSDSDSISENPEYDDTRLNLGAESPASSLDGSEGPGFGFGYDFESSGIGTVRAASPLGFGASGAPFVAAPSPLAGGAKDVYQDSGSHDANGWDPGSFLGKMRDSLQPVVAMRSRIRDGRKMRRGSAGSLGSLRRGKGKGKGLDGDCGICFEMAVTPCRTVCCGKVFCLEHISDWLQGTSSSTGLCPSCDAPCSLTRDVISLVLSKPAVISPTRQTHHTQPDHPILVIRPSSPTSRSVSSSSISTNTTAASGVSHSTNPTDAEEDTPSLLLQQQRRSLKQQQEQEYQRKTAAYSPHLRPASSTPTPSYPGSLQSTRPSTPALASTSLPRIIVGLFPLPDVKELRAVVGSGDAAVGQSTAGTARERERERELIRKVVTFVGLMLIVWLLAQRVLGGGEMEVV